MWTAGVPSDFSFDPMMEEKVASYSAKKVYRIVSVIQPPFMLWNETLSKHLQRVEDFFASLNRSKVMEKP